MVLYPHLATAGVVSTSVPSWVETEKVAAALILTFSCIFHFSVHCGTTAAKIQHQQGSLTFLQFRQNVLSCSPTGKKCLPKRHCLHSRTHNFSLPSLCSCFCDFMYFPGFLPLFFYFLLILCVALLLLSSFPPSCAHILSSQMVTRLVLQTTSSSCVGNTHQVIISISAKVCGHFVFQCDDISPSKTTSVYSV